MESTKRYIQISITTCVVLFAITLRFSGLSDSSLWQDELALYMHANRTLEEILLYSLNDAFHPPFFYYFYKVWCSLIPFGELELRIFHVLIGLFCAILPFFYKKTLGYDKAKLLSLLILLNLALMKWSQEALVYPLVIFLALFFHIQYTEFISERKKGSLLVLLGVSSVIIYTNYIVAFYILEWLVLGGIINYKDKKIRNGIFSILAALFVIYLPWVCNNHLFGLLLSEKGNFPGHWHQTKGITSDLLSALFILFNNSLFYLIGFVSITIVGFAVNLKNINSKKILQFSISFIGLIVFLIKMNIIIDKYILFLIPILLIVFTDLIYDFKKIYRTFIILIIAIYSFCNFNSFKAIKGWQDSRGAIERISKIENLKRVIPYVKNGVWYKPYFTYYGIDDKVLFYFENENHSNQPGIHRLMKTLSRGDVVFTLETEADRNLLISKMKRLNLSYQLHQFDGGFYFEIL